MKGKTRVEAEKGQQQILITRDFDLPLSDLFRAYRDPNLVEQWMGTKVIKLDNRNHGSYHFITTDPMGNSHEFSGVIHEFEENNRIVRTFKMENTSFPVQLEFLEFEKHLEDQSRLNMLIVFKSIYHRDEMMKLPFAYGLNMAHDRIQTIFKELK